MTVEATVNEDIQAAPSGDANPELPDPDQLALDGSNPSDFGNLESGISDDALASEWGEFAEELAGVRETVDIVVKPPVVDGQVAVPPVDEPVVIPLVVDGQVAVPVVVPPVVVPPVVAVPPADSPDQPPAPAALETPPPVLDAQGAPVVSPPAVEPLIPVQPIVAAEQPVVAPPAVPPVAAPVAPTVDVVAQTAVAKQQFIAKMVEQYQMSDADAVAFEAAPAATMAKMAANLHVQVLENVMKNVNDQMPGMINRQTVATTTSQANEDAFLESWPELKDHQAKVAEVAQQYRALHPNSSRDEAIKSVGFNTLLALGVDPVKAANRLANGFQAPVTAPAEPAPKPHTPGGVGGTSSRGMQESPSPNIWSEMIDHQEQWQG